MVTKHNAYDVQLASKTNPAARYVLATDYAALEAENVELKKQCAAFHAEASDHYRASIAANTTLAALREVVPPHGYWPISEEETDNITRKIDTILYTTPETPND